MKIFTKENLGQYLIQEWSKNGWYSSERIGVSIEELVSHSYKRNSKVESPFLDLWLSAFDEMLSWIMSLFTIFYGHDRVGPLSDFDRSIILLLAKIFSDSMAIRNLVVDGYDTAARTILRSAAEHMELLVVIIHDPSFATEFAKSDTPENAKVFWEKHLRPKKIRSQVRAAWRGFFSNPEDEEAALWLADWGYRSFELLSAIAHPSFGGALISAMPLKSQRSDENWLGLWGDKSDASVDTISIFSAFLFPILLIDRDFPFEEYKGISGEKPRYDENNELHKHIKFGRNVLSSMILSMNSSTNREYVFPEPDLSIFGAD